MLTVSWVPRGSQLIRMPISAYATNDSVGGMTTMDIGLLSNMKCYFSDNKRVYTTMEIMRSVSILSTTREHLHVLLLPMEYKRANRTLEEVTNRLHCDLGTAQGQRRALGFSDHIIYGIVFVASTAQIYWSKWRTGGEWVSTTALASSVPQCDIRPKVDIGEAARYHLPDPLQAVYFYQFLCSVKEESIGIAETLEKRTTADFEVLYKELKPWQAPSIEEAPEESDGESDHATEDDEDEDLI